MPRKAATQWEFTGLAPQPPARRVFSVSELTAEVRRLLEAGLGAVCVSGEITNLRVQASGHAYFTLKDVGAQIQCVLFRSGSRTAHTLLADGAKVVLTGDITVYEPRGQHQLVVRTVELAGQGALHAAFERLKQRLDAEGLFAPERKRPLPRMPRRVGIVTSPTGAALRDVLHVAGRRNPALEFILVPVRVQGDGAAREIAAAIALLNEWAATPTGVLDAILVTRGGGSLEDLWAFNEEVVARAVHASALPVVSAVGHEIDFTIADFVADLRAATPSAAAELLTEGVFARREFVEEASAWLARRVRARLESEEENFSRLAARLARVHPRRRLDAHAQRVDETLAALLRAARTTVRERAVRAANLSARLARLPLRQGVTRRAEALRLARRRLGELAAQQFSLRKKALQLAMEKLHLLSPDTVLARGYSITLDAETGRVLRDAKSAKPGQRLRTRLQHGEVRSVVGE